MKTTCFAGNIVMLPHIIIHLQTRALEILIEYDQCQSRVFCWYFVLFAKEYFLFCCRNYSILHKTVSWWWVASRLLNICLGEFHLKNNKEVRSITQSIKQFNKYFLLSVTYYDTLSVSCISTRSTACWEKKNKVTQSKQIIESNECWKQCYLFWENLKNKDYSALIKTLWCMCTKHESQQCCSVKENKDCSFNYISAITYT